MNPRSAKLLGLIAATVAVAAALAARTRLGERVSAARARAAFPAMRSRIRGRDQRSAVQMHTCECGAQYRVSGTDRHRVYWPAAASEQAPVLDDRCVACGAPLPTGRAAARA
jgi:hypothetical protein